MATQIELANAIRALSMDAVQKANSGHPGAPMGMADIAEVLWNKHLKFNPSNSNWSNREALMELDDDVREKILERLSPKEIAKEIEELDTDDAADIISELSVEKQKKVISKIIDAEHKADIKELLKYDEDSAGGLMAKELVKVNENWTVTKCVKEMRIQANEVTRVHSIYVVDDNNKLVGRLSLKDLLVANTRSSIQSIYIAKVDSVNVNESESVANIMQKYDLEAIPVVDDENTLLGRITIKYLV